MPGNPRGARYTTGASVYEIGRRSLEQRGRSRLGLLRTTALLMRRWEIRPQAGDPRRPKQRRTSATRNVSPLGFAVTEPVSTTVPVTVTIAEPATQTDRRGRDARSHNARPPAVPDAAAVADTVAGCPCRCRRGSRGCRGRCPRLVTRSRRWPAGRRRFRAYR